MKQNEICKTYLNYKIQITFKESIPYTFLSYFASIQCIRILAYLDFFIAPTLYFKYKLHWKMLLKYKIQNTFWKLV